MNYQRWAVLGVLLIGIASIGAPSPSAARSSVPVIRDLTLGLSVEERPIRAVQIGHGARALWLIGATHGAPEANTARLVQALADYFRAHPDDVPSDVRLYLVPTLNPDGLALGTRQNAHVVDLNRNMDTSYDDCPENDWSATVQGAYGIVSETGGTAPETEREAHILRETVLGASAIIFYHADGGTVFPASCEHGPSLRLGEAYAAASGYRYTRYWESYMITGGMHDWAASLGIAAITPELTNGDDADVEQNLAAVQAILAQSSDLLPRPQPVRHANGVMMPAVLWRYWRSHGADAVLGPPLAEPHNTAGAILQRFARRQLVLEAYEPGDIPQLFSSSPKKHLSTSFLLHDGGSAFLMR